MIKLRQTVYVAVALTATVFIGTLGYSCGRGSQDGMIRGLNEALAKSESTVKVKDGLYQTTLVEVSDARRVLEERKAENADLLRQLDETKARVLTTERVTVRWAPKRAALEVRQTTAPPAPGSPLSRKRVDFRHDFGPFLVSGYTLTDPPEGSVAVTQGRPLSLTVAVSRDQAGRWLSHVSSSDPDVGVEVTLGAVDPGVLDTHWYQRFWAVGSLGVLGGSSAGLGLEYRGDRFAFGPQCQLWSDGHACGVGFGVRLGR